MSDGIDWVIAVRQGDDNEELRYAIRSVRANVSGVRDIVIAGHCPPWLDGVRHISVPQDNDKFANVVRIWHAVCNHPEISDQFIFANDDEFVMRPINASDVILRHRGRLSFHIRRLTAIGHNRAWRGRLESTQRLLRTLGYDDSLSCALHIPMLVRRDEMARLYDELGNRMVGHDPITLYVAAVGNLFDRIERVERDVKITGKDTDPDEHEWRNWRWLSTSDASFRNHPIGLYIRESFPDPSEHESDAPGHVPVSIRMTDMGYTYRNTNTGDVATFTARNARLDRLRNWKLISEPPAPAVEPIPAIEVPAPVMRRWLDYRGRTFEVPDDSTMFDGAWTHALFTPEGPLPCPAQAITRCGRRACPTKQRQIPAPAGKEAVTCPECLGELPDDWTMPDKSKAPRPEPSTFD